MNIFLNEIQCVLPRILGAINQNEIHPLYGVADRQFWAWRTIDFGNATNQGSVEGISLLLEANLWPYENDYEVMVSRINSLFSGTKKLMRKNGSLEESFPFEQSWCVSALVSYNLAGALENYSKYLKDDVYKEFLSLILAIQRFVVLHPEKHAKISNHLAVATASLYRGYKLTGSNKTLNQAQNYLETLITYQNQDGGFHEYHGFDPGYQTLTMDYLADMYIDNKIKILKPVINKSLELLNYFVMPDGTFGGKFGSRGTQVYYPGGIARLANEFPSAMKIHMKMKDAIKTLSTATLRGIDEGNLIPLFNSYSHAAVIENKLKSKHVYDKKQKDNKIKVLEHAGFIIDSKKNHYTIISLFKGGYFEHYTGKKKKIMGDLPLFKNKFAYYSSAIFNQKNKYEISERRVLIISKFGKYTFQVQKPFLFVLGRIIFYLTRKSYHINILLKKIIVKKLFNYKFSNKISNKRYINLGKKLSYNDEIQGKIKRNFIKTNKRSNFEQMASASYWQISNEKLENN